MSQLLSSSPESGFPFLSCAFLSFFWQFRESLLSVENNSGVPPGKVIEVKDNWANIRATMDTGAAGHVMPAEMFRRVECHKQTCKTVDEFQQWR